MEACCSRFTAAEGGTRLAAAASSKNILAVEYASFIPVRLLYERAYQIRGALSSGSKRSFFVTRATRIPVVSYEFKILTDLTISSAEMYEDIDDWESELEAKEIVVCTAAVLKQILEDEVLKIININVLVLDSCHLIYTDDSLKYIMQQYKASPIFNRPTILGLTYPLFTSPKKETRREEKKECQQQESQSILSIKTQTEITRDQVSEVTVGVYENLDDFGLYEQLEWKIEDLESQLCCQMDLAEDVDGGKRISNSLTKPRELIIEYNTRPSEEAMSNEYRELEKFMIETVDDAMGFLEDHRHDPSEIYGEELCEEFKSLPDPQVDPKRLFKQFLYVLDQLGPYAADKAAFSLLMQLEKLKVKIPYERHYLLLCLCATVFLKIRGHVDDIFSKIDNDWEKIKTYSTHKVLRFAEILEKFHPKDLKNISRRDISEKSTNTLSDSDSGFSQRDSTKKMLNEIDKCDFKTLGNKIQDKINICESNLQDLDDISTATDANTNTDNTDKNISSIDGEQTSNDSNSIQNNSPKSPHSPKSNQDIASTDIRISDKYPKGLMLLPRRTGHRTRGRTRIQRNNAARVLQMQQNPDALCGIVYMKDALIAKIMFMVIVDMSRCNPKLSYLCAQYCAIEAPADPGTELKECQRQGKKQEDVLKKFRMHECNLLLATSALEEGIDLPRCNLVLRWDIPPSYRSYGLCRGRARAARASSALFCSHSSKTTEELLHNVAIYRELDQIISRKCGCGIQDEPPLSEEEHADRLNACVNPYTPNNKARVIAISYRRPTTETNISDKNISINDSQNDVTNTVNTTTVESLEEDFKFTGSGQNLNDDVSENDNTKIPISDDDKEAKSIYRDEKITNKIVEAKMEIDIAQDNNYQILKNNENIPLNLENQLNSKAISECDNFDKTCIDTMTHKISYSDISKDSLELNVSVSDNDISFEKKIPREIRTNENFNNVSNEIINGLNRLHIENINDKIKDTSISSNSNDGKSNIYLKKKVWCNKCTDSKLRECKCVFKDSVSDINISVNKKNVSDIDSASVDLSSAIALINRYCGKLPSDTFTRLAPQWWMEEVLLPHKDTNEFKKAYICTLRLPLNCPVKYNIVGHPMPTRVLARRMVALQACRILHKSGELDNQLMPIGKENFKATELEASNAIGCTNNDSLDNSDSARPGTTKRRQYYYKRTAWAFTDCQPVEDTNESEMVPTPTNLEVNIGTVIPKANGKKRNMLYAIVSSLWCALPERYNTRGRRLHAPQSATQALGILMAREEPDSLQIPAFPVYTRSGEVRVSVEHVPDADVRLSPRRGRLVRRFMRFVFAEVLRVRRRGMKLQSDGSTHNNYYIVPTIKYTRPDGSTKVDIDWAFLDLIYQYTEDKNISEGLSNMIWECQEDDEGAKTKGPAKEKADSVKKMENPLLKVGETFIFDSEKYREAVVTPWYRNQDQPQFFLVAEICWKLSPDSSFPSAAHTSFRDYYSNKYGVTLTQKDQPLLDVDHTSARLNLLTPRYVNRKGVALPVSSERTRRAKRDRLDQKQILVPELCRVHPFAAPLWFATVALPCVLYRINALLIADEIRRAVAIDVGLGIPKINENTIPRFQWPPLDFGWSLAEVLSADSEKTEKKREEELKREQQREKELREKQEMEKLETRNQGSEIESNTSLEQEETKEKTINDILQEKECAGEGSFEIGTWSNDMASQIPLDTEYDDMMGPLPPNLTFCTSACGGTNWCDPIEKPKFSSFNPTRMYSMVDSDCSYMSSDLDSDDSDFDYDGSDDDDDRFCWNKNTNISMGVRIEYKTAHEAEAVDLERTKKINPAPTPDETDDALDRSEHDRLLRTGVAPSEYIEKFRASVEQHKKDIVNKGNLIPKDVAIPEILPENKVKQLVASDLVLENGIKELFPYGTEGLCVVNGQIDIESIEKNKRIILEDLKRKLSKHDISTLNCFSMKDIDIDSPKYVNEKVVNVGFDKKESYEELCKRRKEFPPYCVEERQSGTEFDFDYQPKLQGHPGPSPSVILQSLTMSNANDGINLERLETIGDSFLKFAITAYLYCAHPTVHEGKLSHMRSKQVSNLNLYRLGRNKRLGARMIASKFEPHDNWLPPCHKPPPTLHPSAHGGNQPDMLNPGFPLDVTGCFIPYNLITQHSIPDKSIADCVEALIGAYLLECGPRGALLFMSWLGIKVLPCHHVPLEDDHPYVVASRNADEKPKNPPSPPSPKRQRVNSSSSECSSDDEEHLHHQEMFPEDDWSWSGRPVGSLRPYIDENGVWMQPIFGELKAPPSPLLRYIEDPEGELQQMLSGYDALECTLQYRFKDRSLLLQALTHASHHSNRLTDCYQRLEFLGDAILDYLITRHLYEDPRRHSPGALTDLRSALVNNTIFATLAARHGFHKYFRHMSPGLNEVLTKYVKIQEENGHSISEEHYLIQEDEMEQAEDVEVPKALGDLFESVAGAIFLDSGMSLGAVWKSYVNLMGAELEAFSAAAPKSPVRELLEAEPDTAKFGKPERLADGRRVRVCVEVFGRGTFKGVGRNYRIAKGTAARCALRHLRGLRPR